MVNSNLPRSNFPFIWEGQRVNSNLPRQSWSTQICLDLIFPLFLLGGSKFPFTWGGLKLVNSNLPRSNFPFIAGVKVGQLKCLDLIFPLFGGLSKLVNSNLPRSNFPFIWEGQSWSTQICLDLIFPLFLLGGSKLVT